ncbi:hypothetical protein ACFQZE_21025 [Paenibacillus sp. GCM10027627]|uniref:hypothetical protein n=1 Tax=unclassified Paenibacillus TaxID=185978 RepID=UPI00362DE6DD
MKHDMLQGWRLTFKHMNLIVLLFLYQLLWGFLLYRVIDDTITPLLRRFPAHSSNEQAVQSFLTEAQFQLFKTDLIQPYLWMLGGLFLVRMLVTPLFNAGLFYSIHRQNEDRAGGTRLLEGIRSNWKSVMLLYWGGSVLMLAPAWWLVPDWISSLRHNGVSPVLFSETLPGAAGWIIWSALVYLLFLSMQFGAVTGEGILNSLWSSLKRFFSYGAISLIMWGIAALLGIAVTSMSLAWAGLFAVIVHQAYPLIQTLLRVWTLAAQFNCLNKTEA